jgi:protein SCO1/2
VPGNDVGTRLDIALPQALTSRPLLTSDGHTVTLDALRGKIVVLSDATSLCQETCPLDTAALVQTARQVDATAQRADVVFLSLTVDPQRDTPAQLTAYRNLFNPPPANWLTLTGAAADVNAVWDTLGVWRQRVPEPPGPPPRNWRTNAPLTYDIEHSDEVFFLDQTGHERFILEGAPHVATGQIPQTLYGFMDRAGHANLATAPSSSSTVAQAREAITWLDG